MRTALRETSRTPGREVAPADDGDARLIERTRDGDDEAYGELYRRHADAALGLARNLTRSTVTAEDLVADAFAAVLLALRNGSGPREAFRPYLLTTVRRRSWRTARRPEDPVDPTGPDAGLDLPVLDADGDDAALLVEAYRSLPERWQLVLWHTEVEGQAPAAVAPLVGLSSHATAALAHRAREGLREAFLQAHLREDAVPTSCRSTVAALGAVVRGRAGTRDQARADAHLAGCERCRRLQAELVDVNRALRSVVGPLVLGGAAAAYLGTRSGASTARAAAASGSGAGRTTGRHLAIAGTFLAASLALLVLGTDLGRRDDPAPALRDVASAAAAQRGPAVAPANDAPGVAPALAGGGVLRSVATPACAADLGVAVATTGTATGADAGAGSEATSTIVRAVLVPAGTAGLTLPDVAGVVRPVTGRLADTLRGLVADPAGDLAAPTAAPALAEGTCVRVAPSALLAGDGAWALLVAFLPAGASAVDDLQFAVLGRPLVLLGPTVRTALADARATLADELRALGNLVAVPTGADALGGTVDDVTGLAPAPSASDVLSPFTDDPSTGTSTGGTTTTNTLLPALPPVTDPLGPLVTVPPLPTVTLPPLPLP